MANKNYRSANNRTVDMDTLRLKNEEVRAVGNMGVNARGDRLDNENKTVDSRNRRIGRQYKKQTNVVDAPVASSIREAKQSEVVTDDAVTNTFQEEVIVAETVEQPTTMPDVVETEEKETEEPQGLAAAIARAREVKQEEILPPRKASQQTPGVKKI